ncbi:esterase-like activity of phytase family protein [Maricaulis parjimensis]|uniref:esterase-like activity of phytase family protein n=1 Tax=Maricaulis parjimensis TaxID=144023 RepID=UPI00193AAE19|nr:esterase-like activity of phytase family protein [Maricaulis parjimensis]
MHHTSLIMACLACLTLPAMALAQTVTPVALSPDPSVTRAGQLVYRGGVSIEMDHEGFGGLSALELSDDGSRMLAISDSAWWVKAEIVWTETNELANVRNIRIDAMLDPDGEPLEGRMADSEGLTRGYGPDYLVSFEREHRIWAYPIGEDWSGTETALPRPFSTPDAAQYLGNNQGLESLARLPDRSIIAGVEYPSTFLPNHTIWRLPLAGEWDDNRITPTPTFGLTGLAVHDGEVYALERFWARDVGNRIRIRRFAATELSPWPLQAETIGALDPPMIVDNFEGIAVIEREGETLLLILSDDNFSDNQRTLLLAFAVEE